VSEISDLEKIKNKAKKEEEDDDDDEEEKDSKPISEEKVDDEFSEFL